jgi:DNA helicase HerA-like ATPase
VERVAKEGRKYGVSAMIVSQRPSELSETVLAQCNSFIVMRISNPEDQKYVTKVVGDHFAGVIQMLPVLRPGEAFVIGDSVLMPMRTLVKMPSPMPRSGNMDFFKVWASDTASGDLDEIIRHWRLQDRRLLDGIAPGDEIEPVVEESSKPAEPEPHPVVKPPPGLRPAPRGPLPRLSHSRPRTGAPAAAGPSKWPPARPT